MRPARILVFSALLCGTAAPAAAQEGRPAAGDSARDAAIHRTVLVGVSSAATWIGLSRLATVPTHEFLDLRSGDDGYLYGWVVTSPWAAAVGAGLGAVFIPEGRPVSLPYHYGAALFGAYLLPAAAQGGVPIYLGAAGVLLSPAFVTASALALPKLGADVSLGISLLVAGAWTEPCPYCGDSGRRRVREPASPVVPTVAAGWSLGHRLRLGAELSGVLVEEGWQEESVRLPYSPDNTVAAYVLATASRELRPLGPFALASEAAAGVTGYHERPGLAAAAGVALTRPLSSAYRGETRVRALWLDGVLALQGGLALVAAPDRKP